MSSRSWSERAAPQLRLDVLAGRGVARRLPDVDVEVARRARAVPRTPSTAAGRGGGVPPARAGGRTAPSSRGEPRHLEARPARQVEDVRAASAPRRTPRRCSRGRGRRGSGDSAGTAVSSPTRSRCRRPAGSNSVPPYSVEPVRGDHLDHVAGLGGQRPAAGGSEPVARGPRARRSRPPAAPRRRRGRCRGSCRSASASVRRRGAPASARRSPPAPAGSAGSAPVGPGRSDLEPGVEAVLAEVGERRAGELDPDERRAEPGDGVHRRRR